MSRIGNWWHQLMESTAPRDPDQYFSNKGEGGRITDSELSEIVDGPQKVPSRGMQKLIVPGGMVECRVGERILMRTGYSEAVTDLRIDNKMMEAEVLPDGVQFYDGVYDQDAQAFRRFGAPMTYAEAGVMELNGRLYYKNT
jgi:hypothetical protein